MLVFSDLDAAYHALLQLALEDGSKVSPRGKLTRELCDVVVRIDKPRSRFVTNAERKWSLKLAFGELAWHLAGSRDVDALAVYAKRWRQYSVGSEIAGSCYGHRIFSQMYQGRRTQWDLCKEALLLDQDTRRAVIQLYDPTQNDPASPDVSCTMNLQFILRNGCLNLTTVMRSNDVYFGFPYDVHLYSTLQELMALELGVQIGTYTHFAVSMHLYEKDVAKAARVVECDQVTAFTDISMRRPEERALFCEAEASLRSGNDEHKVFAFTDEFWRQKFLYLQSAIEGRAQSIYSEIFLYNDRAAN